MRFAFLFWKTLKNFLENNCRKICTIEKFVVPLHPISINRLRLTEYRPAMPDREQTGLLL